MSSSRLVLSSSLPPTALLKWLWCRVGRNGGPIVHCRNCSNKGPRPYDRIEQHVDHGWPSHLIRNRCCCRSRIPRLVIYGRPWCSSGYQSCLFVAIVPRVTPSIQFTMGRWRRRRRSFNASTSTQHPSKSEIKLRSSQQQRRNQRPSTRTKVGGLRSNAFTQTQPTSVPWSALAAL